MAKRAYHNPAPSKEALPDGAPKEAVKREFAKRLQSAMVEKGWNQSELARQTAVCLESGKFGRDNASGYVRGLHMPGPVHLRAMAQALGKRPEDLLPMRGVPSVDTAIPPLDIKEIGHGRAWLRVNQAVDWSVALKIMALLKGKE